MDQNGDGEKQMTVNLCEIRTHWINVLKDTEKASQMNELLDKIKIVNHKRKIIRTNKLLLDKP